MCFNRWVANVGAGYGLASHACERCVLRFDMVFDRRTRGVGAESARSRDGVVAETSDICHESVEFQKMDFFKVPD